MRIYPGFAVSTLVVVLVLAPALWVRRHGDLGGYWSATPTPWHYLGANWSTRMGEYSLADTFTGTPYGNVVNGSLWTLRYEIVCYLAAVALALVGALQRRTWVTVLVVAGLGAAVVTNGVMR